jgi:site-specific DNA recombinase
MSGVIRDGRHAGGRAYGYRPVLSKPGELLIDVDEAAIVREIFESYVGDRTPREIAAALNKRKVSPPRGRYWTAFNPEWLSQAP